MQPSPESARGPPRLCLSHILGVHIMSHTSEFPATLIDVHEVARRLDVSARTVFRMAASGEIPAGFRVRNLRRWRSKDVDEAIARMAARPAR